MAEDTKNKPTKLNPFQGKQTTTVPLEIKSFMEVDEDGQKFGYYKGYASTFGNIDRTRDVIAPGAFKRCLDNGRKVKMCWQHDMSTPIGSFPTMKEDEYGLYVEGRINLGTNMGREAYALLKAGDLDSMSIGFMVDDYDIDDKTGVRTIKEIDLWEISIVTEPANTMAMVTAVKSLESAESYAEIERIMRTKGFSRKEATATVWKIKELAKAELSTVQLQETDSESRDATDDEVSSVAMKSIKDELAKLTKLLTSSHN